MALDQLRDFRRFEIRAVRWNEMVSEAFDVVNDQQIRDQLGKHRAREF